MDQTPQNLAFQRTHRWATFALANASSAARFSAAVLVRYVFLFKHNRMTDNQARGILLNWYYEHRREGDVRPTSSDLGGSYPRMKLRASVGISTNMDS